MAYKIIDTAIRACDSTKSRFSVRYRDALGDLATKQAKSFAEAKQIAKSIDPKYNKDIQIIETIIDLSKGTVKEVKR